jgi:OOP family OmpA-OmpF porin
MFWGLRTCTFESSKQTPPTKTLKVMTLKIRIREKAVNAVMIAVLLMISGIYSGLHAQVDTKVANAGIKVRISAIVSPISKAEALQHQINSGYEELKPVLTPGGQRLYFSRSANPDNTAGVSDDEDIWYSEADKKTNTWSEPVRLPGLLNNHGPNFINNVSVTGDTIILGNQYLKKGKMRAGISYSVNVKGEWSAPKPIHIENDYNVSAHANAFVSLKKGIIISAIQRAETVGNRDLYVSFWDGVKASEPVNMGMIVNSDQEESSPYLAPDNKTLYFASKGHNGFGGYDIFVTKRLDETWTNWSQPENLGSAVNGELDDEFFSLTPCGQFAVFSRRVSVHNVDLFKISINGLPGEQGNKIKSDGTFASL